MTMGSRIPRGWRAMMALVFALALLGGTVALANTPLTAEELLAMAPFNAHVQRLLDGEIVMVGLPDMESGNELVVVMAVWVPAALKDTVNTLQRQANDLNAPEILAIHEIAEGASEAQLRAIFQQVTFESSELQEVRLMMDIAPGSKFNLSGQEIALIRSRADQVRNAGGDAAAAAAMAAAMAEVLAKRYQAYRARGLDGLAAYKVGPNQEADPSVELLAATEAVVMVQERMPDYYHCLRHYPRCDTAEVVHQFFWKKQQEGNRPLFVLKHWLSAIQPDYALITERQFYLSHALNSLQVVIGCMPYNDGTLVVLLNQAFTDKVDVRVGRTIAKGIGRRQVEHKIRPIFEKLKAAYAQH